MRNANNPQMLKILNKLWSKYQEKQTETANPYQIDSLSAYANLAVAGFWGEIFGGKESSSSSGMSSRDIQLAEIEQNNVIDLFNPNHPTNYIFFPATKHYADTNNIGSAKVFATMSEEYIFEFYKKLTGRTRDLDWNYKYEDERLLENSPHILLPQYAPIKYPAFDKPFCLRNYSYSESSTNAKWTIEIPKLMVAHVLPSSVKRVELKFLGKFL